MYDNGKMKNHNSNGPDRSGRGKYNGDYSGQKKGEKYLEGKARSSAPNVANIKIGGIAQHSIKKNQVENPTTIKARLNRF